MSGPPDGSFVLSSCATLEDGVEMVNADALNAEEEALQKQLQDIVLIFVECNLFKMFCDLKFLKH